MRGGSRRHSHLSVMSIAATAAAARRSVWDEGGRRHARDRIAATGHFGLQLRHKCAHYIHWKRENDCAVVLGAKSSPPDVGLCIEELQVACLIWLSV